MFPETIVITIEYFELDDRISCRATCEGCAHIGYGDTEWEAIADLSKAMIGYQG